MRRQPESTRRQPESIKRQLKAAKTLMPAKVFRESSLLNLGQFSKMMEKKESVARRSRMMM
jgi:hypothetical protein